MNSGPKIWITQSLPRARDTAKDYADLGLEPIISPVLQISSVTPTPAPPNKSDLLIFTSRNGVRAFADICSERANSVICVGAATAELARSVGFVHVKSAEGDAQDVVKLVLKTVPRSQTLRHCCGKHVQGGIAEQLSEAGYKIERVIYYEAYPVGKADVNIERVDYVALYSPRGASAFIDLLKTKCAAHLTTLSISAATDSVLEPLGLANRLIAETPDQTAIIKTLRSHFQTIRKEAQR
ncbi:uroporphyrinogen-III synthase [Litorimonas haliclonae]|uniref:uroporphyrinogen-III synthase n=1 Tax=Litorimonas haliclonae TaxID=2081977 RepID=UPI0039EE661D